MPNFLSNDESIQGKWGAPPALSAPNIGELLKSILTNRLLRDKMTQENIADTIKNVRENRQGDAYTEQLKASGLLPAGSDVGGPFGAKYGHDVADMLLRQKREEREQNRQTNIMDPYYQALTNRANRPDVVPGSTQDDSFNQEFPEVKKINGIWHRRSIGPKGRINYLPYTTRLQEEEDLPERTLNPAAVKQALANAGLTQEDIEAHDRQHGYIDGTPESDYNKANQIEIEASGGGRPRLSKEKFEEMKRGLGLGTGPVAAPTASPSPSANPDVTAGPLGSPTPAPSGTPRPTATPRLTAQNYGVKGVYMRAPNGEESYVDPQKVEAFKRMGAVVIPAPRQ